jgi:pimeloyl-ACP methyl ester carboxylesterase
VPSDTVRRLYRAGLEETIATARAALTYVAGTEQPEVIGDQHSTHVPVVLLHGFAHNWSAWASLIGHLWSEGFDRIAPVNYDAITLPLDTIAEVVGRRIDDARERFDADRVHVVAHSLGGLAVRAWMANHNGDDVIDRIVTLGAPHQGTPWAYLPGLPPSLKAVRPGSSYLTDLPAQADDRWTTVGATADVVVPHRFAHLPGAHQVNLDGVGHLGLLHHESAWRVVTDALKAGTVTTVRSAGMTEGTLKGARAVREALQAATGQPVTIHGPWGVVTGTVLSCTLASAWLLVGEEDHLVRLSDVTDVITNTAA